MMQAAANTTAGLLGLAIFFTFWVLVAALLLRKGAREKAREHANIPFKEQDR